MSKVELKSVQELISEIKESKLNDKTLAILLDALLDLARGAYMQEETLSGSIRRYKEKPDRQALEFLTNRILGSVPQTIQGTGKEGAIGVVIYPSKENKIEEK